MAGRFRDDCKHVRAEKENTIMMLIPTISIVGSKNSGKTSVARELIAELSGRGLRVAAAKHSHHGFDFSAEGRDTALFEDAGAETVFFVGEKQTVCTRRFEKEEKLAAALARYAPEADVLVAEGWRRSALPKVLVFLEEEKAAEREYPSNVKAVVCPVKLDIEAAHFKPGRTRELADFLLAEVMGRPSRPAVTIIVNGEYLPAKGFVQQFVVGGLLGMVSALKGGDKIESLQVSVKTCPE
jgi:molybdopterin-guanine dinucleotide biosynthesis protein B